MQCSNALLNLRVQKKQEEDQTRKRQQWQDVKNKCPDVAAVLIDVNRVFGKPKAVRVEQKGAVILESGEF